MRWWQHPVPIVGEPWPVPLYCVACDCGQRDEVGTPCWQCGGPTQTERPPDVTDNPIVRAVRAEDDARAVRVLSPAPPADPPGGSSSSHEPDS